MKDVKVFMEELITEGRALDELCYGPSEERTSQGFLRRYHRWSRNILKILDYISLNDHLAEAKSLVRGGRSEILVVGQLAGLIESAYDLTSNGFMDSIRFLLHEQMFTTTIEQAKSLSEAGHMIPAAVLGRIVLEKWLRDQAERAGIPNHAEAKASMLNDGLKNAKIFPVPKWRQIQALLDVGNAAAHGQATDFTLADVSRLLDFAEANCT